MESKNSDINVLVCEDEAAIQFLLEFTLESVGFNVTCASDGEKAIAMFKNKPHVILLDNIMPKYTGIECLKRVKEITPHSKVIMCSAHISFDKNVKDIRVLIKELNLDVYDFIEKPFYVDRVVERVKAAYAAYKKDLLA